MQDAYFPTLPLEQPVLVLVILTAIKDGGDALLEPPAPTCCRLLTRRERERFRGGLTATRKQPRVNRISLCAVTKTKEEKTPSVLVVLWQ